MSVIAKLRLSYRNQIGYTQRPSPKQEHIVSLDRIIDDVIGREGGFSNHPADRGGPTKWGITQATARRHGYDGDMRDLPRDRAVAIYRRTYWHQPGFAGIAEKCPILAEKLFDIGVNMGPATGIKFLQRALNAMLRRDEGDALARDGVIGPATLAALEALIQQRGRGGERALVKLVNGQQATRYLELVEQRPANGAFLYGWISNRIG